jgi:hypothetical protein
MKRLVLGIIIGGVLVSHPQMLNSGSVGQVVQQVGGAAVGLVNQTLNAIHR